MSDARHGTESVTLQIIPDMLEPLIHNTVNCHIWQAVCGCLSQVASHTGVWDLQ